jgi:hypothetical protein
MSQGYLWTAKDVARAITGLPFGEMMQMASEMASLRYLHNLETGRNAWADLLAEWAQRELEKEEK